MTILLPLGSATLARLRRPGHTSLVSLPRLNLTRTTDRLPVGSPREGSGIARAPPILMLMNIPVCHRLIVSWCAAAVRLRGVVARIGLYVWHGPAGLAPSLRLEWRFLAIRWAGIVVVSPALLLTQLPTDRLIAAYSVLLAASTYNYVLGLTIPRRPDFFVGGYLTSIGDALLNVAMLSLVGGFDTPFYFLLYTVTISAAMRYGYGPATAMALTFVGIDVVSGSAVSRPLDPALVLRSGFLLITAVLAGFLRQQARQAESALAHNLDELRGAYAELAAAHDRLLSVDRLKTDFITNVSHELRTPLTSIRAFSELQLSYPDDVPARLEFAQIINTESERLSRLVDDVLDIMKMESGQVRWREEPIDLAELTRDVARAHAALINQHSLTLQTAIDVNVSYVRGDRDRLHQVISNLVTNAVKFTARGTLTLACRQHDDEICVGVTDTGMGVAPQDQERIFQKFQQVGEVLGGKPKGTGLGLAICREIVERHGGRLWVESEVGRGSTFTFSVPVVRELELSAAA